MTGIVTRCALAPSGHAIGSRTRAHARSKNYAYQNWKAHRSGALRPGYLDNPA
jgi:hypothetical protein